MSHAFSPAVGRFVLVASVVLVLVPGVVSRPTAFGAEDGALPAQAGGRAQGARGQAGAAPTMAVDFLALAADGAPVADLTATEVAIRVNGRARAVQSIALVPRPGGAERSARGADVAVPFGTNAGAPVRTTLFVVEDESIAPGRERDVREIAARAIALMDAGDRVGLITLPRPVLRVAPTTDASKVTAALDQITGRRTKATTEEQTCRARDSLDALAGAIDALGPPDGPRTVLVFSGGLMAPGRTPGVSIRRESGESAVCEVAVAQVEAVSAATSGAGAQAYVIQIDEQVGARDEGLEALAAATSGGAVLRLSGAEHPVDRIAKEATARYVATVEGDAADRGNQLLRLDIGVSRAGVTVRAPSQIGRPRGAGRGAAAAAVASPRDMVRSTEAFRGLPLRVVAYASRQSGDKLRVLVLAEPEAAATVKAASAGLVDASGRVQQTAIDGAQLAASPMMAAFDTAPGDYRVRVAAVDADGRAGAADYEIDARLTDAGALKLSGLVLGSQSGGGFAPALQFEGDATVVAYFEAYGPIAGNVAARVEIAKSVDGPALTTVRPGGRLSSEPDKVLLTAELPIGSLEPGDYVVRAFLKMGDGAEGRLLRTLRKVR